KSYTPHLMVVQLLFDDGVALVDPLALHDLRPLVGALAGARVVGHALSSDLRILADAFEMLPREIFDTQVAAAFVGYGLSISLLDLVRDLCGVTLRKSQTVSDWSTRPFTARQVEYLVDDVRYLFALEDRLHEKLRARGRETWAEEEMPQLADLRTYRPDPRRLYLRISGNARMNRRELGILNELAHLRDRYARERNIPLKYVLPDDVMIGLVQLRPKTVDDLSQLRRIDAGTRRTLGERILEAMRRGEAIPEDELPPRAPKPLGAQREALVSTMAVLIGALAAENDLPTTLLLPRAALERIAREAPQTGEALGDVVNLTSWRRHLVVEPLWDLLTGESVLRVRGYRNAEPRTTIERLEAAPEDATEAAG
ncbi:MAG TPA: HRDC domain-containing protein, partial [Candidatus Limnocylindrales bacterium]|nr:HRDC domain-containing protein [Candidatus Limnocylindrales bacterium]